MNTRIKLGRPSPAFALAAVALFVALGGTGYAATHASKAAKPLTSTKVEKLIARYAASHPATIPVVWRGQTKTSTTHKIAIGPWKAKITCNDLSGHQGASVALVGPGAEAFQTTIGGTNGSAGQTFENVGPTTGGGAGVSPGGQLSGVGFLNHGKTVYEVSYNLQGADQRGGHQLRDARERAQSLLAGPARTRRAPRNGARRALAASPTQRRSVA